MKKEKAQELIDDLKYGIAEDIKEEITEDIKEDLGVDAISAISSKENRVAKFFDSKIEPTMWHIKFVAFIAVVTSLFVSVGLMIYGIYEASHLFKAFFTNTTSKEIELLTLNVVDIFLFAMVMMIFSFGSYNLFISKIDNVSRDIRTIEIRPKWVQVENFGELKSIFIKVVEMILIITFLELVVTNEDKFKEDIYSLLIIPIGIVLIALSLKLLHYNEKHQ